MTRLERKLLLINGLLGTGLTLLVLLLDWGGQLQALERWFYDRRALYCQFFAKPPTDRLVFLDIDDPAINTIGRWPWDRRTMAGIIDEVAAAGPQLIFLDILYPEAQRATEDERADGSKVMLENDPPLVASLHRAGNVLVPISLDFDDALRPQSTVEKGMLELLMGDLELSVVEVTERLRARGLNVSESSAALNSHFVGARRLAMYRRIEGELTKDPNLTPNDLRPHLLPKSDPRLVTSPLLRLLVEEFKKLEKLRPLQRFSRTPIATDPPLLGVDDELAPLMIFSREAGGSGFINYIPDGDGIIRRIPLLVKHRGRVLPQIGLVIACKLLEVDPNDVRISQNEAIIPRRSGGDLHIPVATRVHEATGIPIGTMFDVPYVGGRDWETMFDPKRKEARQHVPVKSVWQVSQTKDLISENNSTADRALVNLTKRLVGEDEAKQLEARKLDPTDADARAKDILAMLKRLGETIEQYKGDLKPAEKEELADLKYEESGLRALLKENQNLTAQLSQQRAELKRLLGNKAVIVGSIATATADDIKPTPLHSKCPGMIVHGVIANGIVTGELWRTAPLWIRHVLTVLMGLTTTGIVLRLRTTRAAVAAVTLAALYLLINGIVVFDYFNIIVGVAGPIVAVLVTWVSCQLIEILVEKAERRRITRRFSSYADPALVKYVIDHPEQDVMSGHEREMTVVFTDLAGFTTISETLREKVVPLLNEYLGMMAKIVARHNGYVNKFLGDGIMFFYNAPRDNPDHAADAIVTVLEMQEAVAGFNKSLKERGLPEISMRAGITTGPMVVGDAGSTDRADYTVIGDNVNLAARLESANKATDTKVLMTVRTAQMLGDRYLVRPAARLQVKGKSEGVDTCVLVARASEATEQQRRLASLWKQIFDAYVRADFTACKRALDELESTAGTDKLTQAYRELCEQYLKEPPMNGFDGHIVLHEK
jgi:class 3 adenylate cyclase/CHASE2 domain-containing sensor protein